MLQNCFTPNRITNHENTNMNARAFDFSTMSTDELMAFARELASEMLKRMQPVRTLVVQVVKKVKAWFF